MQEFTSGEMRNGLLLELPFEGSKELVELIRFDNRPWDNLRFPCVKPADKVSILPGLNYLLEFERESIYLE